MPALRMTEHQRGERALLRAIARGMVDTGLEFDGDVAQAMRLTKSAYSRRLKEPYRTFGCESFAELARTLHFTGKEVCEIVGVPYAPQEGE